MRQTLTKRIALCFVGLSIIVTLASCKAGAPYYVSDYLSDLAIASGIGDKDDYFDKLLDWKVVEESDTKVLDKKLYYIYLKKTIESLIDEENFKLEDTSWVNDKYKDDAYINKEKAKSIIDKAVEHLNNKEFPIVFEKEYKPEVNDSKEIGSIYLSDDTYKKIVDINDEEVIEEDADFDEIFSYLDVSGSFDLDFSNAEIIPYGEAESDEVYVNNKYKLLSNKTKVFNVDGFRISYSLSTSGIDVHVSKDVNNLNMFGDLKINNVKPTFKWTYKENDIKNCYFDVKFNSSVKLGVSDGKYKNYYVDIKNADKSSVKSFFETALNNKKDHVEASIPICKIKTPIPEIPTAFINMELMIKLYASGKAQLVIYNKHNMGFETKDGNVRFINELDKSFDSVIQASSKAGLGANISLETAGFNLADVQVDGGLKAKVQTTIHLYDEEGQYESYKSDAVYADAQNAAEKNEDVKVCGDISFHWFMDLLINTSKTKMSKYGLSREFNILDDDNQVFGNLHHLENGHFVQKCTRKNRNLIKKMDKIESNKIVLDSYAEVIKINETYTIIVKSIPTGYKDGDLVYSSKNNDIATVENGLIRPVKPGSVQIEVKTRDGVHTATVNILVSTG